MREQIVAQISLGITSGDLVAGEKLPSTRELARRFCIHQNTISNAYRRLAELDPVEFKKGSGVYIREKENRSSLLSALDQIISRFFHEAAAQGFTKREIEAALQKRLTLETPAEIFVVESELDLRKILIEEVSGALNRRVEGTSFENLPERQSREAEIWLMFDKPEISRKTLPPNVMRSSFIMQSS